MTSETIITNPYLCYKCDNVAEIPDGKSIDELKCGVCDFHDLAYAIHIPGGTRKRYIRIEESSPWKRNKRIEKSLINDLSRNKEWAKRLESITDQIFVFFNESVPSENFPTYRVDYPRTSGKSVRIENRRHAKRTKRGSVRGELYEVYFLKAIDQIENVERCVETFVQPSTGKNSRPDAIISFDSEHQYPVEFKTVGKGDFLLNKMSKHLGQSHAQGLTFDELKLSKGKLSMLIVCCPEERVYTSLLIDERISGRIRHLRGRPSLKKQSRKLNREKQQRDMQKRREREQEGKRSSKNHG